MNAKSAPTGPSTPSSAIFSGPRLDDVLATLGTLSDLNPRRRRDLMSAVRRVAHLLGADPTVVPADLTVLRKQIAAVAPAMHGMTPKTLSNVKCNLVAAFRLAGIGRMPRTRSALTPPWATLARALPDKRMQNGLSRIIRFCSAAGIEPDQVDDGVIESFIEALQTGTFVSKVKEVRRSTTRLWNEATATVPGWPQYRLTVPDQRKPRESLPLTTLAPSFQRDVECYLAWLADDDPFTEHRPARASRPGTIRQTRLQIVLAASALIRAGREVQSITSLTDLVQIEAFKTILRRYLENAGGKDPAFARRMATMLVSIARNWVRVGSDQVDRLKEFRRRLGPERSGLTDKNRAALRQFDDDGNRRRLLELPGQLFHEANERDDGSTRAAIKVQMALAIEILLNCPIRMQNLISLRFDRHILRPGGATGPTFLVLPPGEVKNDELIEFEVPVRLAAMIGTYRKIFRPRLVAGRPDDNPFLFLSSAGTRKGQGTLAQQIQQVIRKHTGLVMTPHQFRHLSAKLFLEMRPGSYELVRRLLNHKNMKTTSTFYAGLQTGPAAKLYDELLLKERERLRAADPPKPRRRRSALRISNPDVMPPRSETRGRR